jgi:hypothetical protein
MDAWPPKCLVIQERTFVLMYEYGWGLSWIFVESIGILVVLLKPGGKTGRRAPSIVGSFVVYPWLFLCTHSFRSICCPGGILRLHRSWRDLYVSSLVETERRLFVVSAFLWIGSAVGVSESSDDNKLKAWKERVIY